jgi:hypothetical protein
MKIDVRCGTKDCGKDDGMYMEKVKFIPSKYGEIGTIELRCRNCGNRVYLELDI